MFDAQYARQTELLLRLLPALEEHPCFALKGGTAINLFVRDMPRVSVDIDLTYLPMKPRTEALEEISENLRAFAHSTLGRIPGATVREHRSHGYLIRATFEIAEATVKIEPNTVLRGAIYPAVSRDLTETAQWRFGLYARVRTLSTADLYGGKLCAALDRQHPRDLFDVKLLLGSEGITPEVESTHVV